MADAFHRPRYLDDGDMEEAATRAANEKVARRPFQHVQGVVIGYCEKGHVNYHPGAACCFHYTVGEGSCNKSLSNFPDEVMTFISLGAVDSLEGLATLLKQFGWSPPAAPRAGVFR